jgi:S-adenosylmethionine:diacylglycerol 3-amino-3-carboxypropyl transferase
MDPRLLPGNFRRPPRVVFGRMHEDASVELRLFHGRERIFAIASAGDTAMALAAAGHDVVACDINPAQLSYAARRLDGGARETGQAERTMSLFRALGPVAGWSRSKLEEFLALDDPSRQALYWQKHLDTRRFRAGFDLLFSRPVLRAAYSADFLRFLPRRFGAVLRERLRRGFARHPNGGNPYARAMLVGGVEEPDCVSPRRHVSLVLQDAASYLEQCEPASFDGFTLSNILDGAARSYAERIARAVRKAGRSDAFVILRTFGTEALGAERNFAEDDRAMLWGTVGLARTADWRPV